jgi:carbamoyltransferase
MWYEGPEITKELAGTDGVQYQPIEVGEAVVHAAAEVASGRPVAWVMGRAEHGPRALGSRSIISSASADMYRGQLNNIKSRESFRPVAPFTSNPRVSTYFDLNVESPYMMQIVPCTDLAVQEIPAAVHADRTARVQTVRQGEPLAQIIDMVETFGCPPVLINTSFNVKEPIVNSPREAIATFLRSPLRSMVLDGYIVTKKDD